MGRGIAILVIARVDGRHRPLATAGSFEESSGRTAPEACLRLVRIFSSKHNRLPLQAELCLAADWYRDCDNQNSADETTTPVLELRMLPIINTCLLTGAASPRQVLRQKPMSDWELRRACERYRELVCLDITDLSHVRYCFLPFQPRPDENVLPLGPGQPLSAQQYIEAVSQEASPASANINRQQGSTQEARNLHVAEQLSKHPLVSESALIDIWPKALLQPALAHDRASDSKVISRGGAPLWEQTMAVLVRFIMHSPPEAQNGLGLFDAVSQLPAFKPTLRRHLIAAKEDFCRGPGAPILLRAAYAGEAVLDWVPFHSLSPATILASLNGPELRDARSLAICPDWATTEAADLAQAICAFPNLQDLYILEHPSRWPDGPTSELYAALLTHPHSPKGKLVLASAFKHALRGTSWMPDEHKLHLPPYPPTPRYPVLQLVINDRPYAQQLRRAAARHLYTWLDYKCYFLADAFLTPMRFVNGFLDAVAARLCVPDYAAGTSVFREDDLFQWQNIAVLCARAAPVIEGDGDGGDGDGDGDCAPEVSPLSGEAYGHCGYMTVYPTGLCDLHPSTWTAVVHVGKRRTHGPGQSAELMQCAFVRPREGIIRTDSTNRALFRAEDLEILDWEGFLRANAPDFDARNAEALDRRLRWLEQLGQADQDQRLSFSRAGLDSEMVCKCLNEGNVNEDPAGRYRDSEDDDDDQDSEEDDDDRDSEDDDGDQGSEEDDDYQGSEDDSE